MPPLETPPVLVPPLPGLPPVSSRPPLAGKPPAPPSPPEPGNPPVIAPPVLTPPVRAPPAAAESFVICPQPAPRRSASHPEIAHAQRSDRTDTPLGGHRGADGRPTSGDRVHGQSSHASVVGNRGPRHARPGGRTAGCARNRPNSFAKAGSELAAIPIALTLRHAALAPSRRRPGRR